MLIYTSKLSTPSRMMSRANNGCMYKKRGGCSIYSGHPPTILSLTFRLFMLLPRACLALTLPHSCISSDLSLPLSCCSLSLLPLSCYLSLSLFSSSSLLPLFVAPLCWRLVFAEDDAFYFVNLVFELLVGVDHVGNGLAAVKHCRVVSSSYG